MSLCNYFARRSLARSQRRINDLVMASLHGGMKRAAPAAYELRIIAATVAAAIAS